MVANGNDSTAQTVAKQLTADSRLQLTPAQGGLSGEGGRAHEGPGLYRVARQEIHRAKASATGTLQFEHGKGPFAASYDQATTVRPDDGSRDAGVAGSRL
jgi:hypothetical protein